MLVAEGEEWCNVIAALHAIPIDRRIAGQYPELPLGRELSINLTHRGEESTVWWGCSSARRADHVLPDGTKLFDRHVAARDIEIQSGLMQCVPRLDNNVVDTLRK